MTALLSRHHKTQNGVTSAIWHYLWLMAQRLTISTTTSSCAATSIFLLHVNISNPERDMWEYSRESLIQTHVYTHTHRCRSAQWPIYFPTCALLFLFPDQQQLKCTWIQHDKNVLIVYDETPLKPDLGHVTINMS